MPTRKISRLPRNQSKFILLWKRQFETFATLAHDVLISQPAIACSKLKIETLEQGVKYVQS